jgi:predicted nuclease of predicted toxin-antitoxin system
MKLLLDENLSRRIVPFLQDYYPESTQVILAGLEHENDRVVWEYAREHGFVIVTKDDDFNTLLSLRGYPPKLIRLAMGNCNNQHVLGILIHQYDLIISTLKQEHIGLIELY